MANQATKITDRKPLTLKSLIDGEDLKRNLTTLINDEYLENNRCIKYEELATIDIRGKEGKKYQITCLTFKVDGAVLIELDGNGDAIEDTHIEL